MRKDDVQPEPKFGERIRQIRMARRMNQAELGDLSGVNSVTISQIERGANTTTDTLQKLADALECKLGDFFCHPLTEQQLDDMSNRISDRFATRFITEAKGPLAEETKELIRDLLERVVGK